MKRLALAAAFVALAATRPGSEFIMLTDLNGQEVRWTMADGGPSGMFGTGQQCMPLAQLPAAANSTIEVMPGAPINLCVRSAFSAPSWDGGCNGIATDPNFGVPLQPFVPKFMLLSSTATHLCQVSDAGTGVTSVFSMQ